MIENVTNSARVSGMLNTGGLVGVSSGNVAISNSTNNGNVVCNGGDCNAGGFVGNMISGGRASIRHSTNNGNLVLCWWACWVCWCAI